MKKFSQIVLVFLLSVGMFTGCGTSYKADESTVFVLKDGKIVSTDVENFDEKTYDKDGLKEYVKNETNYNNVVEFAYEIFLKIDDEKSYGYVDAIVDAIREIMFIDNKPIDKIGKWDVFDKINY